MSDLKLTLACGGYDRTKALQEGRVRAEGIDLTILNIYVAGIFWRILQYGEFYIAVMSFSYYLF